MTLKHGFLTATDEKTCFIVFSFSVNPTTEKIFFLSFIRERTKLDDESLCILINPHVYIESQAIRTNLFWIDFLMKKCVYRYLYEQH